MSDKALSRIEKRLEKICSQVATLSERVDALAAASPTPVKSTEEVIAFLDQFRAGEALGEASLGAWIAVSDVDCVRGGLRVIQQREGMHARLLAERIKELGGSCSFEIPDAAHEAAMADAGDAAKPDAEKLLAFVKQFGDAEKALKPIYDLADALDDDPETQSLLRSIAQDERSTLEFLTEACTQLNG
ncbi:MAG: hypothetical protein CL910_19215 [Deltaproteobacteria bacterium]|jgi:hypothetical protein|nr:hypothetical protein [Deltaproteobacteria bacterium]